MQAKSEFPLLSCEPVYLVNLGTVYVVHEEQQNTTSCYYYYYHHHHHYYCYKFYYK